MLLNNQNHINIFYVYADLGVRGPLFVSVDIIIQNVDPQRTQKNKHPLKTQESTYLVKLRRFRKYTCQKSVKKVSKQKMTLSRAKKGIRPSN